MPHTNSEMLQTIMDQKITSTVCITAAVIQDNAMYHTMTAYETKLLCDAADCIENARYHSDDPRFSLYDYMDAIVNHRNENWVKSAERIKTMKIEDLLQYITELAENKRRIYESE